jgi:hypothetical protein
MTAEDTTPEKGQDSTGVDWSGYPLQDKDDETIALVLEDQKGSVQAAVNEVNEALLNEEVALTNEKVGELYVESERLVALTRTLACRLGDRGDDA